jgi:hypothetical protein
MDVFVDDELVDGVLAVARRDSAEGGGGGGGGGEGAPVPGDGVRTGAGGLFEVVVTEEEAPRLGELVPMNWSAGAPAAFHLIPCGKCFLTNF